jgi:hypothetical protein
MEGTMLKVFILVLIYSPQNALVLPHQYQTEEACRAAAFARQADAERFACIKIHLAVGE